MLRTGRFAFERNSPRLESASLRNLSSVTDSTLTIYSIFEGPATEGRHLSFVIFIRCSVDDLLVL